MMRTLHICNDYRNDNLYSILFTKLSEHLEQQTVYVPFKRRLDIRENNKYDISHSACYTDFDRIFFGRKSNKIYNHLLQNHEIIDFNLVHAHTLFSNGIIAYKIKKEFNIDYIISVRGTDVEVFFKKMIWLRKKGLEIMLNAKKVIFISYSIKNNLFSMIKKKKIRDIIERKSIVIPNGINDFWLKNMNKKTDTLKETINILQVGWINNNKNQLNSFKAIEILNNYGIDCGLTIIGGIEYDKHKKYYQEVKEYISKSKYKNKVRFIGRQSKEVLINFYRDSDIFMMPSYKETFGLVFVEALSQGLPIIYTKSQGVDGYFNKCPVGVAVAPENPTEIAEGVKHIINNYTYLTGNIGMQLDIFNWDSITQNISNLYKE